MKNLIILAITGIALLTFTSCVKNSGSKKVAEDFYSSLADDDFKGPVDYLSDLALDVQSKKEWKQVFKDRNLYWGKPESWKNTLTEMTSTEYGEVVELRYEVKNEEGTTYETMRLREEDGKMKILYYCYTDRNDYVLSGEAEENEDVNNEIQSFPEQEKVIDKFYSFYKNNDYTGLESIISKTALENSDIEKWKQLLAEKADIYGKIKRQKKISAEKVASGEIEYYVFIYEITFADQTVVYEKFEFSTADDPEKIMYYQYNRSMDEL